MLSKLSYSLMKNLKIENVWKYMHDSKIICLLNYYYFIIISQILITLNAFENIDTYTMVLSKCIINILPMKWWI
jgi:hypothetical protein